MSTMPRLKISKVFAVNSEEDPSFPASNLLGENNQKWQCKEPGQKSANVTLELSEPAQINAIDIGNEHSCYITVLVGRKGFSDGDFKEILLMSSFMSVSECRNSDNPNRVRCFTQNSLVESVCKEKWELIKIICTQPYNNRVRFGLSFIRLYGSEESKNDSFKTERLKEKKAVFSLREESPDSEPESLFSRWKQQSKQTTDLSSSISVAADIRDSTSVGKPKIQFPKTNFNRKTTTTEEMFKTKDRNREDLLYKDEDDQTNEKLEKFIEEDKKKLAHKKNDKITNSANKFKQFLTPTVDKNIPGSSSVKEDGKRSLFLDKSDIEKSTLEDSGNSPEMKTNCSEGPSKRRYSLEEDSETKNKQKKQKLFKPFGKLLEGVVLTISGIQNPERGQLREKALEMGAKYRPDWDNSCTHLICAFRNTPKYNQVRGKGKIVRKNWISQCHSNRRRIPWRRFALDEKEEDKPESEEELWAEKDKVENECCILDEYKDDIEIVALDDSGSDTEDEIRKIRENDVPKLKTAYDISTDDEGQQSNGIEKKTFFANKNFFLDNDVGAVQTIKANNIIKQFGGNVVTSKDNCDFWIKISSGGSVLPGSKFYVVRPLWLEECNDMESFLPIKRYMH